MMNNNRHKAVLVIDDDPTICEFVRRALPDWTVHIAYNGVDGIAFVRAYDETLSLVILDHRMPHDGVLVARQIREINRALRILPFSSAEEKGQAFAELGTAPLLAKRLGLSEHELRAAVFGAISNAAAPLPRWAMLDDLRERADSSEALLLSRRQQAQTVAVLASTRATVQLLQLAAREASATVSTSATTASILELFLQAAPTQVLLSDGHLQRDALGLGTTFQTPVVVVALSIIAAYTVDGAAQGVLIDPDERELSAAFAAVARGERYRDSRLDAPLTSVGLTDRERALLPLILRGCSNDEISQHLAQSETLVLADPTIRRYRAQILEKFAVTTLAELLDHLGSWFSETR